jgi:hypothetical protein
VTFAGSGAAEVLAPAVSAGFESADVGAEEFDRLLQPLTKDASEIKITALKDNNGRDRMLLNIVMVCRGNGMSGARDLLQSIHALYQQNVFAFRMAQPVLNIVTSQRTLAARARLIGPTSRRFLRYE